MDVQALLQYCDTLTDGQSLLEIIQRATALLEDPARWCQKGFDGVETRPAHAIDALGRHVQIADPNAVAVSIEGAVGRVSNAQGIVPPHVLRYLDGLVLEIIGELGEPGILNEHDVGWFNDSFDHGTIMQLMYLAQYKLLESAR